MRASIATVAAVPEETRAVLLGHKTRSMLTHYSVAELAELLAAVNRIDRSLATRGLTGSICAVSMPARTQAASQVSAGTDWQVIVGEDRSTLILMVHNMRSK